MKRFAHFLLIMSIALLLYSCKEEKTPEPSGTGGTGNNTPGPRLYFTFKFDSTQQRLNNIGQPSVIPAGNAAQTPRFRKMSAHYIEMTPEALTGLGQGLVLYHAPETTVGGETAIEFDKSTPVGEGEEFFSIPLSQVNADTYKYLRVSLAYQNYDIQFKYDTFNLQGSIASFIGYNTYITQHKPKDISVVVNANKKQGYWAFETVGQVIQGQAPPGATTVPNPIFATSPVPQGSCVVTGPFASPLVISANETKDIHIVVSLSVNKSFEWKDSNSPDGIYEPGAGDTVVDMGVRGLIPIVFR
jgi:hypothetical protein